MSNNENKNKVPLIITTEHKGVFFGYGTPSGDETIKIEQVRMVVYWAPSVRGLLGLAANGPDKACRISPPAPAVTLRKVTACIEVSPEATKKFEDAPWSN